MAVYERAWQFSSGFDTYQQLDVTTGVKRRLWAIKAFLTGQIGEATQGLWTVVGSSDGVTGAMDGVDRWGTTFDPSKIPQNNGTNPRGWCVLRSPVMASGIQMSLLLSAFAVTGSAAGGFVFAKTPFTGGAANADPTSVDSWSPFYNINIIENQAGTLTFRLHGALSSTGDFFLFDARLGRGGNTQFGCMCIAPVGASAGDAFPVWTYVNTVGAGNNFMISADSTSSSTTYTRNAIGSAPAYNTISRVSTAPYLDMVTGKLIDTPAWVFVTAGTTMHARGRLPDIGITPGSATGVSAVPVGTTVRNQGTNAVEYIICGWFVLPFNAVIDMS